MNEIVAESHQRTQASDHATAELMYLKSQLQQTNSQLSDAQQVLAAKVTASTVCVCVFKFASCFF